MVIKKLIRVDIVNGECTESLEQNISALIHNLDGALSKDECLTDVPFNIELQGHPFHDVEDGGFCQMVAFYEYIEV